MYIEVGTRFRLDGTLCEVTNMYKYGKGAYVQFKRLEYPYAPLFEHGVGTLNFYYKVGRLVLVKKEV